MTQFKSQILGLILGLGTAIGCIFYEKLVHNFSYRFFLIVLGIDTAILFLLSLFPFVGKNIPSVGNGSLQADCIKFFSNSQYILYGIGYISTCITGLLWYGITKDSSVMVSSIYEVKYIVMLAVIYIIFGDQRFTLNTAIGVLLALSSIYFISKK